MRIVNKKAFDVPRIGPCEWCDHRCVALEWAHVWPRSRGRLDVSLNRVMLGGPWDCGCHLKHHQGQSPTIEELEGLVGLRLGTSADAIRAARKWLLDADKDWHPDRIQSELALVDEPVRALIERALEERT